VLHGRDLGPGDRAGSPRVAVIGDTLARELGPPGAALGQRLKLRWGGDPDVETVGVVGDVHLASLDTPPRQCTAARPGRQQLHDADADGRLATGAGAGRAR
jgi:hypothetical protein